MLAAGVILPGFGNPTRHRKYALTQDWVVRRMDQVRGGGLPVFDLFAPSGASPDPERITRSGGATGDGPSSTQASYPKTSISTRPSGAFRQTCPRRQTPSRIFDLIAASEYPDSLENFLIVKYRTLSSTGPVVGQSLVSGPPDDQAEPKGLGLSY